MPQASTMPLDRKKKLPSNWCTQSHIPPMDQPTPRPTKRCPICGKPALQRFRPFCSKRCADIDLNRWLSGRYAVPVVEEDTSVPGEREDET